jgi:SpoVK/Ycf46/Vps4 family AAA+-type ATPase
MKIFPQNYSLVETSYGNEYPAEQLFIHFFDRFPSKYFNNLTTYSKSVLDHFLSNGFKLQCESFVKGKREYDESYHFNLLNSDLEIFALLKLIKDKKENFYVNLSFLYNPEKGKIQDQIEFLQLKNFEYVVKKSGINLIKYQMGQLDTEEYEMNISDIDLEKHYGKDFLKVHDLILKRLNTPQDKGIVLFHGDPGTGKTSYIKYLTHLITNKEILFIPPSMAETLSEPSIIPFLMDHKNSILIVEDAERVISDRELNGSSMGVSNILNLTDGILGDCLNIQIIATFNMKREKIDPALLRKGRLIAEHKFKNLSSEESNILLKHLGKENKVKTDMCLADIYNIDEEIYKNDNRTTIGFNN